MDYSDTGLTPGEIAVAKMKDLIAEEVTRGQNTIWLINRQYTRSEASAIRIFLEGNGYTFTMRKCRHCKDLWDLTINIS